MILSIIKMEESFGLLNNYTIGMQFKHFIWEFGFQFFPTEKGIGLDSQFKDKSEFSYMQHKPLCNINQWGPSLKAAREEPLKPTASKEQDSAKQPPEPSSKAGPNFDQYTCTCGYTDQLIRHKKFQERQLKREETKKLQAGSGQQREFVNMLQTLFNGGAPLLNNHHLGELPNEPGEVDEDEEYYEELLLNPSTQLQFAQPQLIIVDPLNKFNNIGKSSYNFAMIQQELRDVYTRLTEELVNFVRIASEKQQANQQAKSQQNPPSPRLSQKESTYTIDGLISRIFNVDYQMLSTLSDDDDEEDSLFNQLFLQIERKNQKSQAASSKKNKAPAEEEKKLSSA
mmetsp:Transcript_70/g.138  ORF Transcript_70/g.138 Transcript_70/m.138 type:complete len:341 (+) Transcript_70:3-1025(+)